MTPDTTPETTPPNNLAPTSPPPRPSAGGDLRNRPRPLAPSPMGGEVELAPNGDPVENPSSPQTNGATWTPTHPATEAAWQAVVQNLTQRAANGLWSSREITVAIAKNTGITRLRAVDLIASAIRHGYLEERPYPGIPHGHHHSTQVRLPVDGPRTVPGE